jgi:AraC-like DNA-binding protein
MTPLLRLATLTGYLELTQSLGLDPGALMDTVGLDPADLATPDKWIPAVRVLRLLDLSARTSGRDDFGLRLAEYRRLSALGPLGLVLRDEPTLRSALDLCMRYEHTYNEALRTRMSQANGMATVQLWFEVGEPAPTRQAEGYSLGVLRGIIREFLGPDWQPLSVCFSHSVPTRLDTYATMLGARLRFEHSFTGMIMYTKDLDAPNANSDPSTRARTDEILRSLATPKGTTTSEQVRDLVEVLLPTGRCSADEVARTMGVDRKTLYRHLADTRHTFTSIVDSTRAGLAERYLSTDRYQLTEISVLLGFAAPSVFSRWFRHRFGETPSQWRTRRADLPGT